MAVASKSVRNELYEFICEFALGFGTVERPVAMALASGPMILMPGADRIDSPMAKLL